MAYDKALHHDWLRLALRQLEAGGTSPGTFLSEMQRAQGLDDGHPFIRQTFERFVHGDGKCRNEAGLVAVYDYLKSKPNYSRHLNIPLNPEAFGPSLVSFYSGHLGTVFPLELAHSIFPGQYTMCRPDFAGEKFKKGYFRFSGLLMEFRDGVLCVTENQVMPGETPSEQTDHGVFMSHGDYGCVLLRGQNVSCVKLMVIKRAISEIDREGPVDWFGGVLFVASHAGIFPAARFFCRRVAPGAKPVTGSKTLKGSRDSEALAWLANPLLVEPDR